MLTLLYVQVCMRTRTVLWTVALKTGTERKQAEGWSGPDVSGSL